MTPGNRGLVFVLLALSAGQSSAAPCSDEEAERATKCATPVACAWTYSYTAADGRRHERSWCYGTAALAQKAFDDQVKLADTVARYFDEPSEAPSLNRVYCDACGEPTKKSVVKKLGKGAFGRWWYQAQDKIKDVLADALKRRLQPGLAGNAAFWVYKQNDLLNDLREQHQLLDAEVSEWAEGGTEDVTRQLDQLGDDLRDAAAKLDASRVAAPAGVVPLPAVIEVPTFIPPAVESTVEDAAGLRRDVQYSLRLGFDNRFHVVFANRGAAPREFVFKTQHSEPVTVVVPANGATIAVVPHTQSTLLPVCNPLDWGAGCGVQIVSSQCAVGEVRDAKGVCMPDCPTGLIGRRTPRGVKCECPPKKQWDNVLKVCLGLDECPPGLLAVKSGGKVNCTCPAKKRFQASTRSCVDDLCVGGAAFDARAGRCACPSGRQWSKPDGECVEANCSGGTVFSEDKGSCVCPSNQQWNSESRVCECPAGTIWFGDRCAVPTCGVNESFDWNSRSCVCVSGTLRRADRSCGCPNTGEVFSGGRCQQLPIDASGAVTSRDVMLTVRDSNAVLDDVYQLFINDRFVADIANPPGGQTQIRVSLSPGDNLIELRLVRELGQSTRLELLLDPGSFRREFSGSRNHRYLIRAP